MNASFSSAGSIVPDKSSSKISNACLISITYSLGIVSVTYQSGLNLGGCILYFLFILLFFYDCLKLTDIYFKYNMYVFSDQDLEYNIEILKMSKQYELLSNNPRIRSFLSVEQKYGCRSFSTSQPQTESLWLNRTISASQLAHSKSSNNFHKNHNHDNSHSSYMKLNFKTKDTASKEIKTKMNQFQKRKAYHNTDKNTSFLHLNKTTKNKPQFEDSIYKNNKVKDYRNIKENADPDLRIYYTDNPNINKNRDVNSNQDGELHMLILQMKDRIKSLEKENLLLRQQQVEDICLVKKQNQVIFGLEDAIKNLNNKNKQLVHVIEILQRQNVISPFQCGDCIQKQRNSQWKNVLISPFAKLKEQKQNLSCQIIELKKITRQQKQQIKNYELKYSQLQKQRQFPRALIDIWDKKNQEINAINQLLRLV